MIRHLLKLVWNRKRSNALLLLEIFASFLVTFVVVTLALFAWSNYRRPLGFDWTDVWNVAIDMNQIGDDTWTPAQSERFERLLAEAKAVAGVESVAGVETVPFGLGSSNAGWTTAGRAVRSERIDVTPELRQVLHPALVAGRWFTPDDAVQPWRAVIVTRSLARDQFGDQDPLGKPLRRLDPGETEERVIGVIDDFRRAGELSIPGNTFLRLIRSAPTTDRPARNLLVRVAPGTPVAAEERLLRRLQAVAPDWSFEVQSLSRLHDAAFRLWITPLAVGGIVAFFLLSMVALGLLGVLWQNLLRRTREMGLRRAAGATAAAVQRQVLLEQALITGLGVLLGLMLILQLPLFGLTAWLGGPVFAGGVALAVAIVFAITLLCGLYPSLMVRRLQPAEALRYE